MRPLAGIRVIECGSYWSASLAATHLAGLGASVIRVLRPTDARGAAEEELFKPVAVRVQQQRGHAHDLK